jgi:isopropylmalate/homocitrate/citramalate synthase
MPKLNCLCGYRISLHSIPNTHTFTLIPEMLREQLMDKLTVAHARFSALEAFQRAAYQAHSSQYTPGILQLIECPNCHRVAVFARASDTHPTFWFQREQTTDAEQATSLDDLAKKLTAEAR